MKDEVVVFLEKIEEILRNTGRNFPNAIKLADGIKEILNKYHTNFPVKELIKGLREIEEDPKFQKHPSLKNIIEQSKIPVEILEVWINEDSFNTNLIQLSKSYNWKRKILCRFSFYAITKSVCEVIKKSNANKLLPYFEYIEGLVNTSKLQVSNFNSLTANSSTFNIKSFSIPDKDFFFTTEPYKKDIKWLDKELTSQSEIERGRKIDRIKYLLSLNITDFEKDIFNGIMDDFEIIKLVNGKQ